MKAHVVIGSGYGDEGKGLFTDYLANGQKESSVIRFNGGAQAGHTVTTPQGKRHVFGHFGSNSLTDNTDKLTFLSEYFVLNPVVFLKESAQLSDLGVYPSVTVHRKANVTTPYDMILNQLVEEKRGLGRHGSCGLGFGETLERSERGFPLLFEDSEDMISYALKIAHIRDNYFLARAKELGVADILQKEENRFFFSNELICKFSHDSEKAFKNMIPVENRLPAGENLIFEGAQGLQLDQNMGAFPYVTRSNTGLKNIASLVENSQITELDIVYATRCYTTRHGAGPLAHELETQPYEKIEDLTNIPNPYQGTLRFAWLDLDILKHSIEKDQQSVASMSVKLRTRIGISCLDQAPEVCFYENNQLKTLSNREFADYVAHSFNCEVLASFGPTRNTMEKITPARKLKKNNSL